jgi:hypothetical protein
MPNIDWSLNVTTLDRKARAAGHVRPDGKLHLRRISDHTSLNIAVVSRLNRREDRPNLGSLLAFQLSYGGPLDEWVDVTVESDVAEAA